MLKCLVKMSANEPVMRRETIISQDRFLAAFPEKFDICGVLVRLGAAMFVVESLGIMRSLIAQAQSSSGSRMPVLAASIIRLATISLIGSVRLASCRRRSASS
jgi:hypothetical protein